MSLHRDAYGDVLFALREVGQAATLILRESAYDPVAGTDAGASVSYAVRAASLGWTTRLINQALQRVNRIIISNPGIRVAVGSVLVLDTPFGASPWGTFPWTGTERWVVHAAEAMEIKGGIPAWTLLCGEGA